MLRPSLIYRLNDARAIHYSRGRWRRVARRSVRAQRRKIPSLAWAWTVAIQYERQTAF